MKTITKTMRVDSDTIRIPELKEFIGKNVDLTILEKGAEKSNKKPKVKYFLEVAEKIDIDEEVIKQLREKSKI